jgi:hypothetical protein
MPAYHPILGRIGAAMAAALAMVGAGPVAAGTVSNVAEACWTIGAEPQSTQSNAVVFDVAAPPLRVQTFVPLPGSATSLELQPSYCSARATAGATASTPPGVAGTPPVTVSTPIIASSSVRAGQQLVITVTAPGENRDPAATDSLELDIVSASGDVERVRAMETGVNTGEFAAAVRTVRATGGYVAGDCRLAVDNHQAIVIRAVGADGTTSIPLARVEALADPFGLVFDSLTGEPVDGARVTLIDADSGAPAAVFAYDGVTAYPSSMITGTTVFDAAGQRYDLAPGGYLFPLTALGRYRLQVEPPAPYAAPSQVPAGQLAALTDSNGEPFVITAGSYGEPFALATLDPLRVDIPVDAPGGAITIQKSASRDRAQPGDVVLYTLRLENSDAARPSGDITLEDRASSALRLRAGSVRIDGRTPDAETLEQAADGRGYLLRLPGLAGGAAITVTYAMSVRPDASAGIATNRAIARGLGTSAQAQARLRVERDAIASRMTLIGRVTDGGCANPGSGRGVAGVRLVLEDGSFAVTDADGRYHFEGLVPGSHAVQLLRHTLPEGHQLVDCTRSTRSAGSLHTRFVSGQGGSLIASDFNVIRAKIEKDSAVLASADVSATVPDDLDRPGAAGTGPVGTNWLALGDGPSGFLTPAVDANPRSPAVRVAVRHRTDETVTLLVDGKPADPMSFDGVEKDSSSHFAVSQWRAIHLKGAETRLEAQVRTAAGTVTETFARTVHFADTPMQAQLVPERSRLVANGTTPPVIAVRLLDRHGRPVHAGISGELVLSAPYRSASATAARQRQTLSGFGTAQATWLVEGDDGVALIELEPTLVSGSFSLDLAFSDGDATRAQELTGWIVPGDQPWTVIGLAEGSAGARSIADAMERGADVASDLGDDARVAFYAKGRVLGKYLLTASYDSAKQRDDQPLLGVIDPAAYYTIFADGSQRLFDAQSREKLYVRIESGAFYALYGDFLTGFTATSLAYYQRAATGVKGELRAGPIQAEGFAARIATSSRRDEIAGSGLTGPYRLSSRSLVPGSENVAIEVRDRLRPELVLSRRELVRFADYTVDLLSGTLSLTQPLAGRDPALNPQFIVVQYEVDDFGDAEWNGGLRASWTNGDETIRVGATAISDRGEDSRTNLGAVDLRVLLGPDTEAKAELALSENTDGAAYAWTAELRHQAANLDIGAYARQVDRDFGVGQQNVADRDRRKFAVDTRYAVNESLTAVASGWLEQSLADSASRRAAELRLVHRTDRTDAYAGLAYLDDRRADGTAAQSTVVETGATHRLLDNRLELSGGTSFALGQADAIDLPARHRLGARYAITPQVKAVAAYEIAQGARLDSRNVQAGLELSPIRGSRVVTSLGRQDIGRDGGRSFAAFSLGQTVPVNESLTLDLLVDGNRTLGGGIARADVAVPEHPVTSGGHLGQDGTLGEDYMAYSAGAMWRSAAWSARTRAELRNGEFGDRKALSGAIIRELGEGRVAGGGATWSRATSDTGASVTVADAALSLAWRPATSAFAVLSKLEFRSDSVTGAVAGETGPAGRSALVVDGDARSRRLIASTSANWSPRGDATSRRTELGLFAAVRHDFDQVDGYDLAGTSLLGGLDLRIGLGSRIELGGRATVRASLVEGSTSFAIGPELGVTPAPNMLVSIGYNIVGFRDRDFAAARSTQRGAFVTMKLKFDQDSFGFLARDR